MELRTEARLATGGEAVARAADGRVVFITGAAPDEQVEVEITETHARFLRARVVRVLAPGPARIEPRCPHFGHCGGCALQHVDAAAQRSAKADAFVEVLRRVGKVDTAAVAFEAPWAGAPWGYRTRARLAVADGHLGYRAAHSRSVVAVQACPVLAPPLEAKLGALADAVAKVRGEHELDLLLAPDGRVLAHGDRAVTAAVRAVVETGAEAADGGVILDASGFAQSNDEGNAALLDTVERWTGERAAFAGEVVELYAGSGNFTRVLARRARHVVAIEGARDAADRARRAMPAHVEVIARPAEDALRELAGGGGKSRKAGAKPLRTFTAAFADPPRAGLHADVPADLARVGPAELLMVSCDPATFARDVGRLAQQGFVLVRARLFDLYPHTAHAEVAGLLHRTTTAS